MKSLAFAAVLLFCSAVGAQPSIVIADDTIVVAGKPLSITVKSFFALDSPALVEALVARRAEAPAENPCGQILAPGSSTFALIGKVLVACSTAGLTSIGLHAKVEQPVVSVSTVAGVGPAILWVAATDLRLIVAGAVTTPFAPALLTEKIQAMRKATPAQLAITVQVDEAVTFASLLEVLEACARGGLSQVTLKASGPLSVPTVEAAVELFVQGVMDKELVRKVVLSNRAQVSACYEQMLAGFPKLDGKVVLKFAIGARGSVSSSVVESTSNAELSTCISDRVKTWTFPRPRGGGAVVVTYPFTFTLK